MSILSHSPDALNLYPPRPTSSPNWKLERQGEVIVAGVRQPSLLIGSQAFVHKQGVTTIDMVISEIMRFLHRVTYRGARIKRHITNFGWVARELSSA